MTSLDIAAIRARFPALTTPGPGGTPPVHADAPGGTQVLDTVLDAMRDYLVSANANSHGAFPASVETDELVAGARQRIGGFFGSEPDGVVFGPNMTSLTMHFARAFGATLEPGDELVCTQLDHDANVAPWVLAAERAGAEVRWIAITPDGHLDLETISEAVTPRTRLIAFPAASNALGTIVDPVPLVTAARDVGAVTYCDAVHAAPHLALDRRALGVDVLACSPYKFFGPHAGVLAAAPGLLAELQPDKVRPAPEAGPDRWQTGTASFEAIAGTYAAIGYLTEIGMDAVRRHEAELSTRFLDGVAGMEHVALHGPTDVTRRTPTFSVSVSGLAPTLVSERLAQGGVWTWAGSYYALEPMRALGLVEPGEGAVRIGFVHYHRDEDVDRVLAGLAALA